MIKLLRLVLWIALVAICGLFLVANRQMTALSLDPFNASAPAVTTFPMPLWGWLIVMLLIGFAAGAAGMWFSARPKRAAARADRRELKALRKALTAANTRIAALEASPAPPASSPPALVETETSGTA